MISEYTKVGDVDSAKLFFDEAPEKDKGIWGAMVSGYVQNSCFKESLYLFRLMQLTDIVPDESIFVSNSACAHLGALDVGLRFSPFKFIDIVPDESIFVSILSALYIMIFFITESHLVYKCI